LFNYYSANLNTSSGANFNGIFGLGERVLDTFFYPDGVFSLWNRDEALTFDNGKAPGTEGYGTHPFYMFKNSDNVWGGVFTNLANAQDWYVVNDPLTGQVNV
jgi:hypothetical protein